MKDLFVEKRNGEIVPFDESKIFNAIYKAMKNGSGIINKEIATKISKEIRDYLESEQSLNIIIYEIDKKIITIKSIENLVYNLLNKNKQLETAKAYEGYRAVQEFKRKNNTVDQSILDLIGNKNEEVSMENSNKNATLISTQRDLIAGEVSKDISRRKLLPAHIVQAHDEGVIHIHDLDYFAQPMTNCCLINLEDMLTNGTVINEKLVETPKSFMTACTIITQIIAQVSSNQYGGQSITIAHIAPFLRVTYDKAYYSAYTKFLQRGIELNLVEEWSVEEAEQAMMKELKAGIQTIRYQLNTLNSVNGQSPFCTIYLEIIEGHPYEQEMALICEEIIKQRLEGMKNYKGQEIGEAFPKLVYVLDSHNCLEGGKYDYITKLAAKCTAKRLVPDYQSAKIMRENYEGNTFPPMGCRSHLSPWKDNNEDYKWYGRFNQGVVSLNLPQIGILAKGDMDLFWKILDERLELCKEALLIRHKHLLGTKSDVAPILWQHGAFARLKSNEKIDDLLKNGYSTISLGYVGIYEMVQAMLGISHTTPEGEKFAVQVMERLKKACEEWKEETGLGFGLYGTPAESLVARFCKIDTERFGKIKNVTDKLYYTNSYHVNVKEEIDAFSKLKFESQFHSISLGGCISYIEVPDMNKNIEAIESIIRFMYHNIQYAEINTKTDICYECGYQGEMLNDDNFHWYCPNCGNKNEQNMQVMRRTCGYIGANLWSKGRTQEIKERVYHL